MVQEYRLPDPGEGIHEAEIVEVCVSEGDTVHEGDIVLHIETDKAAVEVPSPFTGVIEDIRVRPGDTVEVGAVLMTFETQEEAKQKRAPRPAKEAKQAKARQRQPQPEPATEAAARPAEPTAPEEAEAAAPRPRGKRQALPVPASPATRRLALELDVDLHDVSGSGPGGRVTAQDVRTLAGETEAEARPEEAPKERVAAPPRGLPLVAEVPPLPDFSRWGPIEEVQLQGIRRATARQMMLAWSQIPHVMHQDIADITELEAFRRRHKADIEQQGGQLSLTVLIMQAVASVLKHFPRFNASLDPDGGRLILKQYYHIGVAVDTERGLLVPVVRDVDRKSITELATELTALVERVRQGSVRREDLQGGTFTITNPGPIGGTAFTPIINYPEVAILGLASARLEPVVQGDLDDYTIVPRRRLPLHLAFDHRVNDGAEAARLVRTLIDMLHDPESFLINV
jgi:pyruvate dehydrogenase E2 component (dihydrolipoamide acetyltransferase)